MDRTTETDSTSTTSFCNKSDVLNHDLVLDEIFHHLSYHDLLSCSFVNRHWNSIARRFLRDVKQCHAKIQGCQQLQKLNDVLQQSTFPFLPYKSLTLVGDSQCCQSRENDTVSGADETFAFLVDEGIFSGLTLRLVNQETLDCPVMKFLKMYLVPEPGTSKCVGELQELELVCLPKKIQTLGETVGCPEGINLKSLKRVKLPMKKCDGLVEEIISATCPKTIQKIFGVSTEEEVAIARSHAKILVLKELEFFPETHDQVAAFGLLAGERPQLEILGISSSWFRSGGDLTQFVSTARSLLDSSCFSLEKLQIGHLDLVMLCQNEMPVLHQLKHLTLRYSSQTDKTEGYPTLRRINFPRLFPNLTSIDMVVSTTFRHTGWYISSGFRENTNEYVCNSVNQLKISSMYFPLRDHWFQWMKELFPNIRMVSVSASYELQSFFDSVGNTWPKLEELAITDVGKNGRMNVDAALCGLSNEEFMELADQDGEFLTRYQFAPVQPSILHLQDLKRFYLEGQHVRVYNCKGSIGFITHITGHLAVRRLPQLLVELVMKECQKSCDPCNFCDDIKPFVKLRRW